MIKASEDLIPEVVDVDDDTDDSDDSDEDDNTAEFNDYDMMGMRAFKVSNNNERIGNIMCKLPTEPIHVAEFGDDVHAQLVYRYVLNVAGNKSRSVEERNDIIGFMKNELPPRPIDKSEGFLPGAAEDWHVKLNGRNHKQVLERVIQKLGDPRLIRPERLAYQNKTSLRTDQAIMDNLQEEDFFTAVGNLRNAGEVLMQLCITMYLLLLSFHCRPN